MKYFLKSLKVIFCGSQCTGKQIAQKIQKIICFSMFELCTNVIQTSATKGTIEFSLFAENCSQCSGRGLLMYFSDIKIHVGHQILTYFDVKATVRVKIENDVKSVRKNSRFFRFSLKIRQSCTSKAQNAWIKISKEFYSHWKARCSFNKLQKMFIK